VASRRRRRRSPVELRVGERQALPDERLVEQLSEHGSLTIAARATLRKKPERVQVNVQRPAQPQLSLSSGGNTGLETLR
jgi:hypothetical protein